MIDSSFMTTLPDTWAISRHFIMLPLNRWEDTYERVFLGGLTCDSDDYYNSEQHTNAIYLPVFSDTKPLYIGFSIQELIRKQSEVMVEFTTAYASAKTRFDSER
jgi:arginine decarboxylase-like protein